MECNKDEAMRAKEIAVKKMESNDFVGARKIASKAHRLYPHLENIAQLISVCEVHCSAEGNIMGNEKDWYGILQVSQSADDALIKKQYRKLALLLHPDKNKFAGAEAAFKLIGEAQRILLDKEKRTFYDMKRKTSTRPVAPNRPPAQGFVNVSAARPSLVPETFWTHCPFCSVRYQYYKDVVNRALRCQACSKPFIAYDLGTQGMPSSSNQNARYSQAGGVHERNVAPNSSNNNGFSSNFNQQKPNMNSFPNTGREANVKAHHKPSASPKDKKRASKVKPDGCDSSKKTKINKKRGRKQESSESFASESNIDSGETAEDACTGPRVKVEQNSNYRRSARNKRHVSYDESGGYKEMGSPPKRQKVDGLFSSTEEGTGHASSKEGLDIKTDSPNVDEKVEKSRTDKLTGGAGMGDVDRMFPFPKEEPLIAPSNDELGKTNRRPNLDEKLDKSRTDKLNGDASVTQKKQSKSYKIDHISASNARSGALQEERVLQEFPDADFSDFDGVRNADCFRVDQIWAIYDRDDAMPRFYAQIRKVFSVGFKLRISWLEPDPVFKDEVLWVGKKLPVSCGRYIAGRPEITEDRLMFSHPITWEKGSERGTFKIYPRKEEIWALFKDWHIGGISVSDNPRQYEYEFVEVLSDYDNTLGIRVACLGKLKGFASLFCRVGRDEIQIPPSECLRFSHRILSFKMTGGERGDVPKGSFELDPSCISLNLEEIALPPEMKLGAEDHLSNGLFSEHLDVDSGGQQRKASATRNRNCTADVDIDEHSSSPKPESEEANEIPEPDFFDFEATKALDKFQAGQVWALYCDVDGLPKFYACIKKVDIHPYPEIKISWFEPCPLPRDLIKWKDEEIPISCGRFKKSTNSQSYSDAGAFSHQIVGEAKTKKNVFKIYPRKGEIWALYKNWSEEISSSQLSSCDFDIVEVQEKSTKNSPIRVSVLERIPGFNSVFRSQTDSSLDVPHSELLRFSHQIPFYKLTDEKEGSLRGCWELDPAALPSSFFCEK